MRNISEATAGRPSTEGLGDAATRGETFIEEDVVSIIARTAAENVEGVYRIGESSLRALSPFNRHHGIDSEVGMVEAAVDVEIVVDFGFPIRDTARRLRQSIIDTVETMTGRRVVEVNVYVVDVHIGGTDKRKRRKLE